MPDILFPTSSAPGTRPQESAGRLINAFVEKTLVGAPSDVIIRRSPGLNRVARSGTSSVHTRGFLEAAPLEAFWIINDLVFKFDSKFHVTFLGNLAGTKPVTTARNNAAASSTNPGGRQNVVVTEHGAFVLFTNDAPQEMGAGPQSGQGTALPAGPTSVCDIDGYFVFTYANGAVYASELNSLIVKPLSFNVEQGLFARRGVRYSGRLYIFGDKWTAVYRNVGSIPFPFGREVTIPRGIVGTNAVAGWEAGWANELIWVGDDFIVYKLNGYTPVAVSTDDVSRAIQRSVLAGKRDLIEAYVYMYGRNAFWVLNCHEDWTWEYNVVTGGWNERASYTRANWKGMDSIRIFDQWVVGDEYTDELYVVTGDLFKEGTDPLVWHVESGILSGFPMGTVIPRASFHMTAAVGSTKPKVEISWSLDGGYSFGTPVLRHMGGVGESHSFPSIIGSGLSRGQGVRYRLRVSDAVHVGLFGGVVEPQQRDWAG